MIAVPPKKSSALTQRDLRQSTSQPDSALLIVHVFLLNLAEKTGQSDDEEKILKLLRTSRGGDAMSMTLAKGMLTVCVAGASLLRGLELAGGEKPASVDAVKVAFERLQGALKNKSAATLEAMLAEIPEPISNSSIASNCIRCLDRAGDPAEERWNPSLFLRDSMLTWVQKLPGPFEPWASEGFYAVWLRSGDGTRRGVTGFVLQGGHWKWYALFDPSHVPSYDYDLSTTTNAFLTLGRTRRPGNGPVPDIRGVYDALADEVRSLAEWEEYAALLQERTRGRGEKLPGFDIDRTGLEEEEVAPVGGRAARLVWRLGE